jgi:hypothetical protein
MLSVGTALPHFFPNVTGANGMFRVLCSNVFVLLHSHHARVVFHCHSVPTFTLLID